jgi:hypothetical protein
VIEIAMGFGMGFLSASLLIVIAVPFVHERAVRLTTRKVLEATPVSLVEVQAGKDLLRAEFAMSVYRVETRLAAMRTKAAALLAEIGRQAAEIGRLKTELGRQSSQVAAFAARERMRKSAARRVVSLLGLFARSERRRARLLSGQPAGLLRIEAPPLQNIPSDVGVPQPESLRDGSDRQLAAPAVAGPPQVGRGDRDALSEVDAALKQMMVAIVTPPSFQRSLN